MLLILPISATIIPLLFKKWFLMSSLVCPFVSGVQIMTKTVPNIKEVQIVDRIFLYIVIGLDWTGLMSFLTGQDLTPKFAGQVLPDGTESGLIFLTCNLPITGYYFSYSQVRFLNTNLVSKNSRPKKIKKNGKKMEKKI